MHELGLASVGTLPPAVMVDTLQQLCLATGTADATALPARLAKHLRAFEALPELERFLDAVCEVWGSQTTGLPGHASRHGGPFSTPCDRKKAAVAHFFIHKTTDTVH